MKKIVLQYCFSFCVYLWGNYSVGLSLRSGTYRCPWRHRRCLSESGSGVVSLLFVFVAPRYFACFIVILTCRYHIYGPTWQRLFQSRWRNPLKWTWWSRCRSLLQPLIHPERSKPSTSAPWRSWTSSARTRWEGRSTNTKAPWRSYLGIQNVL